MNNLFAGLSALAPGASAQSSEASPQDIPKEELMSLCMKMNKRMQGMEARGKELVKKKAVMAAERQKLLDLFRTVMPVPILSNQEADLDMAAIEQSWQEFEAKRRDQLADLESKVIAKEQLMQQSLQSVEEHYKKIIAELKAHRANGTGEGGSAASAVGDDSGADAAAASIAAIVEAEKEKMAAQTALQDLQRRIAKSDAEIERFKGVEVYLKQQLHTMEGVIGSKNTEIETLQREIESSKTTYEEKVVYLQMQMAGAKAKDEERGKDTAAHRALVDKLTAQITALQRMIEEKDLSYKSNKDMIQALQSRLIEMEPELAQSRDKLLQFERNNSAQAVMKAEQTALVTSLRGDLKNALDETEACRKRSRELEEFKVKAEGQLLKMAALAEQVQGLQSAVEDKDSLITRMRSEQQTSERNHAMRTAMLATCEAQLESLQQELRDKDSTSQEAIERVTSLQASLAAAEARLAERVKEATAEIAALQSQVRTITHDREVAIQTLEKLHEENVEAIKRDHAKKSAMARTLLSEKEEEVRTLSAKVSELQDEISSGTPQERKIFELAASQAKRENTHGAHNDTREIAFVQLQNKLAAKDLELARAQQGLAALQSEVVELRRTHQREGINMDYLKNIVIQYMTFPAQSSEKMSLVPVLAMLLQFTPKELSAVQRVAILEPAQTSIWGSFGLSGESKTPMSMPVFSSSRPAKEVKRPTLPIGAAAAAAVSSPAATSRPVKATPSPGMSSGAMTAAALAQAAGTSAARLGSASGVKTGAPSTSQQDAYQPPVPSTHAAGPLSPSTSNSDAGEHSDAGTYSPPKLPQSAGRSQVTPQASSAAALGIAPGSRGDGSNLAQSSLMVESHTDTGSTDDPTFATPLKAAHSPVQTGRTFGRGTNIRGTPDSAPRGRGSTHRMPINRASSMNASDYEFQQKLKSIGSDILSLDNSMSYDDADIDIGADATYVDYEEGIEEGDEPDDGMDGTSV